MAVQSTESMRKSGESGARAKKRNPYKAAENDSDVSDLEEAKERMDRYWKTETSINTMAMKERAEH